MDLPREQHYAGGSGLGGRIASFFDSMVKWIVPAVATVVAVLGIRVYTFMNEGPRFTAEDVPALSLEEATTLRGEIEALMSDLPPEDFKKVVEGLSNKVDSNTNAIQEFRIEVSNRLTRIETLLEE
jgi:hypothetical protein